VTALKRTNPRTQFTVVPTGDHYDSMIEKGIPTGIAFLKSLK
jgi:hypothetical protein